MFTNECLNVNEQGHLTIGGCDTVELANEFGTPLYVMDEATIRNTCRKYKESFEKYYNGNGMPLYASKALSCKEIYRIVNDEGFGIDVVSGGELYTALSANFPPEKIHFHGNNKTFEELNMAIDAHIGVIVVDNMTELNMLNQLSKEKNIRTNISLRIKPGVDAHTHQFVQTGQIDSKFGFALETGEAFYAVKLALQCENLVLKELHCHIGSQIFELSPFTLAAEILMNFIIKIKNECNFLVHSLNLGGGFGIHYTDNDTPKPYDYFMREVSAVVNKMAEENGIPVPYIHIEPGRSIVGESGITLYTVGCVKDIKNVRTYVSIDGGMFDNIRYALYQAEYTVLNASKASSKPDTTVTVAGKCCETGDLIQENVNVADPQPGEILAVLSTGAYNYSMSSNYNRNLRPAIVMIKDGKPRIIVKRESLEDLIRNDI
ncbi:MAG: diaminopimelate decarboxylase [Bacillota bacterium]|nr:diaminopimelate decarboxylase [Bacillota bacterium]